MNVLFILPKLSGGGAEKIGAMVASMFTSYHQVYMILLQEGNPPYYPLDEKVHLLQAPAGQTVKSLEQMIRKQKRKWNIDCSISFLERSNELNVRTKGREYVIISIRNAYSLKYPKKEQRQLFAEVSQNTDHIVAISKYVKYDQMQYFHADENKMSVIYNPCPIEEIVSKADLPMEANEQALFKKGPVVVSAGRYVTQKGQWHLIRAFTKIVQEYPSAKLVLLGRGEDKDYLRQVIDKNHLTDSVSLCSYTTNPYTYMKHADIFVLPSLYEGLGNVLLEAMACGCPVISSDCYGGPRELLAPGTDILKQTDRMEPVEYGILVPAGDGQKTMDEPLSQAEKELTNAILYLLDDPRTKDHYRYQSRKRIQAFRKDIILHQWLDLLERKVVANESNVHHIWPFRKWRR